MKRPLALLLLAIPLGVALSVLLEGIVQCLPPHYSPVSQPESDLAVGPFGYLESASLLTRAALTFAFVRAFTRIVPEVERSRGGVVLLRISAFAKVVIALVATDLTSRPETVHGTVHAVAALASILGGGAGELLLSRAIRREGGRGAVPSLLVGLGWASFIGGIVVVGTVAVSARIGIWGLLERGQTGVVLLWVLIATLDMWRRGTAIPGRRSTVVQLIA